MKLYCIGIFYDYFDEEVFDEEQGLKIKNVLASSPTEAMDYVEAHLEECFDTEVSNPVVNRKSWTEFSLNEIGFLESRVEFHMFESEDV